MSVHANAKRILKAATYRTPGTRKWTYKGNELNCYGYYSQMWAIGLQRTRIDRETARIILTGLLLPAQLAEFKECMKREVKYHNDRRGSLHHDEIEASGGYYAASFAIDKLKELGL